MSASAQYASVPSIQSGLTTTADTSYTAPTNSTVGVVFTAGASGARIDKIDNTTTGTSVAGILNLWACEGKVGPTISSITSATTTATLTTATAHNLITGDLITVRGAFPDEYNVKSVAVTVTAATTFTYTIVSTGNVAARDVGEYSSTHAAAVYSLIKQIPIIAITGSTTVNNFQAPLSTEVNGEFMPIILPPGHSFRTTVTVTQTNGVRTTARGGQFA